MMRRLIGGLVVFLVLVRFAGAEDGGAEVVDLDWPRVRLRDGHRIVVHQPQIERWDDFERLLARVALEVTLEGEDAPYIGSMKVGARTSIDFDAHAVVFGQRQVRGMLFPDTPPAAYAIIRDVIPRAISAGSPLVMSLEEIVAYLDPDDEELRDVNVGVDPPPIHHRDAPARLVIFAGAPSFAPVAGAGLEFAVNTNWDLLRDPGSGRHFLLDGDGWLETTDLHAGPWTPVTALPESFQRLPDDPNWIEVSERVPGTPAATAPEIIVSEGAAELIVTDGPAVFEPIAETGLSFVANTDRDLFRDEAVGALYLLVAGRWFRAVSLDGPWRPAMASLPAAFADIPEDHPRAGVLASVPGTPAADAAVLLASIPRSAIVMRDEVATEVVYDGEPAFEAIAGAERVESATNTPSDVFRVEDRYYCCDRGVWFVAEKPDGPWSVCADVPEAIYSIPPTSLQHYVTYVDVEGFDADAVEVKHTKGYTGEYVFMGLLVFGIAHAIAEADSVSLTVRYGNSRYRAYGSGARYDERYAGYERAATRYGPYGGAGRTAAFDPITRTYARGAYRYGPRGAASARAMYNPRAATSGARIAAATPYGAWGRGTVVNDRGGWARGGARAGRGGAAVGGVETSKGRAVIGGRDRRGNRTAVAGGGDGGNLFVAKNGQVYRREADGSWQKREGGTWQGAGGAGAGGAGRPADRARKSDVRALQRDAKARSRGRKRTQAYHGSRGGSRGSVGGGGRPGGGRR